MVDPFTFNVVTAVGMLTSALVDIIITTALFWVLKAELRGFNLETDQLMKQ